MKILVTSYYFYPENTPRAFRTYELVKELARQRHEVTVHIPDNGFNYADIELKYGFKIIKVKPGFFLNRDGKSRRPATARRGSAIQKGPLKRLRNLCRKAFFGICFEGKPTEYIFMLAKSLLNSKASYDAVISIGLPFSVHAGTAIALFLRKGLSCVSIADYGDPFSKNEHRQDTHQRWHYWLEKFVLQAFDYITVPIDGAVKSYLGFKDASRIKIVPQGVCVDEVSVEKYSGNKVPVFIYGGNFYRRLRNPRELLDFLVTVEEDFRFIIYTDTDSEYMALINDFKDRLGEKLEVRNFIPRLDFIREASKADFLINIGNLSSNQLPSKIIDYALTGRPILSWGQEGFSPSLFREFMRGEYDGRLKIDYSEYDIRNVCEKFFKIITAEMEKTH